MKIYCLHLLLLGSTLVGIPAFSVEGSNASEKSHYVNLKTLAETLNRAEPDYPALLESATRGLDVNAFMVGDPEDWLPAKVVAHTWATREPVAAAEYAAEFELGKSVPPAVVVLSTAFYAVAIESPEHFAGIARNLPGGWTEAFSLQIFAHFLKTGGDTLPAPLDALALTSEFRGAYLGALAQTDPVGALDALSDNDSDAARIQVYRIAIQKLASTDPARAFALYQEFPDAFPYMLHTLFNNWVDSDPIAALEAMKVSNLDQLDRYEARALENWIRIDPESALTAVEASQLNSWQKRNLRNTGLLEWVRKDSPSATAYLDQLTAPQLGELSGFFTQWTEESPLAAVQIAERLAAAHGKTRMLRSNPLATVMQAWVQQDEVAALEWIESEIHPDLADAAVGAVMQSFARSDPDYVFKLYPLLNDPVARRNIVEELTPRLAERDPVATLDWLRAAEGDFNTAVAVQRLFRTWANHDVEGAMQHFPYDLSPSHQSFAMRSIVNGFSAADPTVALDWFESLPGDVVNNAALRDLGRRFGTIDPPRVGEILKNSPHAESDFFLLMNFGRAYADFDPEQAKAWALSMDSASTQNNAGDGVMKGIYRHDPEAARTWAADLPSGPLRSAAVTAYSYENRKIDPAGTVDYILKTLEPGEHLRPKAMGFAFETWAARDPEAAFRAAAALKDLTEDERAAVDKALGY